MNNLNNHKEQEKGRVNASALGYAITFLFLIGLICTGVLFISGVNKRLELNYNLQEHLLFDNYLSLKLGAGFSSTASKTIVHPAGDSSIIDVLPWGSFNLVTAITKHQGRSIQRSALIGIESTDQLPVLYLPDNNQALKLTGSTKIEGKVFLPERGVERGYIAGKNYINDKLIYGEQAKSEKYLPAIKKEFANLSLENFIVGTQKVDEILKDSTFSFDHPTTLWSTIEAISLHLSLSGNLIVHSFDSIYVSKEAQLENIILIAPRVRFESGFSGSVQVIAHEQIICEENVRLKYPSTLLLNETKMNLGNSASCIRLEQDAQVLGGILLLSQQSNFRKPILLKIERDALVAGLIYVQGSTEIYGKMIGHLYTNQFALKAGGGEYSNHLLDATLSSALLPKNFLLPNWLEAESKGKPKIIACF